MGCILIRRSSVAESGRPRASFPQSQCRGLKILSTCLRQMASAFWICSYDPLGIPLKSGLASFSKLNSCPSNRCHKRAILVHSLAFSVSFSAGCAGKEWYLLWHAEGSLYLFCIADSATKEKGGHVTRSQCTSRQHLGRASYAVRREGSWPV